MYFSICADALDVGKGLVDSAANLVPESVPRPVAKTGVAVVGGLIAFTILQKVIMKCSRLNQRY